MKIVVLKGSFNRNGSSSMLANEFIKGAQEQGHDVDILEVAHMHLHPCNGCGYCGMDGNCVFKDDNTVIKKALLACDMVVFVTPIYYFGVSSQLKMVIDRFYSYTTRLTDKGLKSILIPAAWDSDMETTSYTKAYYEKLCSYMNFDNCGMVLGTGCGSPSMTLESDHMKKAYQLGKSIQ